MAVSFLEGEWSLHKELLVEQLEGIHGLICKEQIWVKVSWIPHSNNAIADHLMNLVRAVGEDL